LASLQNTSFEAATPFKTQAVVEGFASTVIAHSSRIAEIRSRGLTSADCCGIHEGPVRAGHVMKSAQRSQFCTGGSMATFAC